MTDSYQIKTETYAGPIEKLLELIESRKLDITRVSLSEVTADFLVYVKSLTQIDPRTLSDFLVVAARLVLIKSKALLPTLPLSEEEEEDIHDLERRLEIYKHFKNASKQVVSLWTNSRVSYGRELLDFSDVHVFYPSENINQNALYEALHKLLNNLNKFTEVNRVAIKNTIISLESKMEELIRIFNNTTGQSKFSDFAKNKAEAIVIFLAILHLIKDRFLQVEQESQFSDIIMKPRLESND